MAQPKKGKTKTTQRSGGGRNTKQASATEQPEGGGVIGGDCDYVQRKLGESVCRGSNARQMDARCKLKINARESQNDWKAKAIMSVVVQP